MPLGEGICVYFEIENLDQEVEKLIGKGMVFDELPQDKEWLWREARIKDPDGNQLILYYAGKNRLNPPWRLV
ncbi:MAG: bleomycin resistance protein [Cytophagales bacterium]|nr:bleomycin resistance protein [Cytophagales bacterium]